MFPSGGSGASRSEYRAATANMDSNSNVGILGPAVRDGNDVGELDSADAYDPGDSDLNHQGD